MAYVTSIVNQRIKHDHVSAVFAVDGKLVIVAFTGREVYEPDRHNAKIY